MSALYKKLNLDYTGLFDIDNLRFFGYTLIAKSLVWGRNGFDGGFEVGGASSGGHRFNKPNFKIKR